MFKINQIKYKNLLDAYINMEDALIQERQKQMASDEVMTANWGGEAKKAFQEKRLEFFTEGEYAKTLKQITGMRQIFEEELPVITSLMKRCEDLGLQLTRDEHTEFCPPASGDTTPYNEGYLKLVKEHYSGFNESHDTVIREAGLARDAIYEMMDACDGLVNFGNLRSEVEAGYKKIARITNVKMEIDEYVAGVEDLDQRLENKWLMYAEETENESKAKVSDTFETISMTKHVHREFGGESNSVSFPQDAEQNIPVIDKASANKSESGSEDQILLLLKGLNTAVDSYINIGQELKTAPYYTNEEAMNIVLENDKKITEVADKYGVDKAMIQAILFQELRFYGADDPIADSLVVQSYSYEEQLEDYMEFSKNLQWYEFWKGIFRLPPEPVIRYRTDSSTGMGQIFAKTAIEALNKYEGTHYDVNNWKDLQEVWNALQDEDYNIELVALVLKYKRETNGLTNDTLEDIQQNMSLYNGSGDLAKKYGEVTIQYYQVFKKYNDLVGEKDAKKTESSIDIILETLPQLGELLNSEFLCQNLNQTTEENHRMNIPGPGEIIEVSLGVDKPNIQARVSSYNAWSIYCSVATCEKKYPIVAARLDNLLEQYSNNEGEQDLLIVNTAEYGNCYVGAMIEGFGEPGDVIQVKNNDGSTYNFIIIDVKSKQHTSEELVSNSSTSNPQCQNEWGHGYMIGSDIVQLNVCEFMTSVGNGKESAIYYPSGEILSRKYVTEAVVIGHVDI